MSGFAREFFPTIGNRKSKIENGWGCCSRYRIRNVWGCCPGAAASTKIPRIWILAGVALPALSSRTEAFRQGLRELGYEEGKNIVLELRSSERNRERQPALAAELVRLKVDVIVTAGAGDPRQPRRQPPQFPLSWS